MRKEAKNHINIFSLTITLPCDKMNLFDISHITAEEAKVFKSDFWHVADYFSQINETNDYIPNKTRLAHPEEMLKLMKFLTGNEKFDNIISVDKGGPATMFDAFEAAELVGGEPTVEYMAEYDTLYEQYINECKNHFGIN